MQHIHSGISYILTFFPFTTVHWSFKPSCPFYPPSNTNRSGHQPLFISWDDTCPGWTVQRRQQRTLLVRIRPLLAVVPSRCWSAQLFRSLSRLPVQLHMPKIWLWLQPLHSVTKPACNVSRCRMFPLLKPTFLNWFNCKNLTFGCVNMSCSTSLEHDEHVIPSFTSYWWIHFEVWTWVNFISCYEFLRYIYHGSQWR